MLDPKVGRARLREQGDTLSIVIPSETRPLTTIFLCVWLLPWAFGWIAAFNMMLGAQAAAPFVMAWLAAWTVGGLFAGSIVMWNLMGEERVTITPHVLLVERHIPVWSRKTECTMNSVSDFRATAVAMPVFNRAVHGIWSNRSKGTVQFTYGVHTIGIGLDLDEAEARKLVEFVHNRYPQTARRA